MLQIVCETHEDEAQKRLLNTPPGPARSGIERYSAAMHFYQNGKLSAELLEIYRICCKLDHEDPIRVARLEGVIA
tara:strand:- start:76650 stop:76874 length:225 start_codon:yes stop_codon:yes gene_type:complete